MNYNRADAFRQDDDHREDDADDEKIPEGSMAGGTGRVFLPAEHVRFRLETHDEEDKSVSSTVEYGVVHSIEQGGSEGELDMATAQNRFKNPSEVDMDGDEDILSQDV